MKVESIATPKQLAGILLRALGRDHFCELSSKIGLVDVKQVCKVYREIC